MEHEDITNYKRTCLYLKNSAKYLYMDHIAMDMLHPGPQQRDVLYLQDKHRSDAIWRGEEPGLLDARRCDSELRRERQPIVLPESIQRILHNVGFYGVYRIGHIQYDHAFITALVERWRQETHTFHLPVGECTITLQDVAVLLGLPIDGRAVTGQCFSTRTTESYQLLCQELLGIQPPSSCIKGSRLKLSWLAESFQQLPELADDLTVQRYARAWILQALGGSILGDKSSALVSFDYFPLLRDLDEAGSYSWGSAALAVLYREMCRATSIGAKQIGGPLILLQPEKYKDWIRGSIGLFYDFTLFHKFWEEVFGEDWRVVASGESLLHPLNAPINGDVLLIAKINSNQHPLQNGIHHPPHVEWVTNADGTLHGHTHENLYNIVCQTALWRASFLNTGVEYNPEEIATTPDAYQTPTDDSD